jgi:hypothetical protein
MLLEQGHVVATMRGSRVVLGAMHQALHFTSCKHSELLVTTQHVPQFVLNAMERLNAHPAGYIRDGGLKSRARARDKAKRNARRVALLKDRAYVVDNSTNAVESGSVLATPATHSPERVTASPI